MAPRLLERYRDEVVPKLREEFGYSNVHQVPGLVKTVVNIGRGGDAERETARAGSRGTQLDRRPEADDSPGEEECVELQAS